MNFEALSLAVFVAVKKGFIRSHNPKLPMAITQGDGHDPIDLRPRRQLLITLPGHIVGRIANAEHGIEQ